MFFSTQFPGILLDVLLIKAEKIGRKINANAK